MATYNQNMKSNTGTRDPNCCDVGPGYYSYSCSGDSWVVSGMNCSPCAQPPTSPPPGNCSGFATTQLSCHCPYSCCDAGYDLTGCMDESASNYGCLCPHIQSPDGTYGECVSSADYQWITPDNDCCLYYDQDTPCDEIFGEECCNTSCGQALWWNAVADYEPYSCSNICTDGACDYCSECTEFCNCNSYPCNESTGTQSGPGIPTEDLDYEELVQEGEEIQTMPLGGGCLDFSACNYGDENYDCEYESCLVCNDPNDVNYLFNCNTGETFLPGDTVISDPDCCLDISYYAGKIVISEFKTRPNSTEFIELFNRSDEDINLEGMEINAIDWGTATGSVGYGLPNRILAPGEYVVLASDRQYNTWSDEICKDIEWNQAFCPECDQIGTTCTEDYDCMLQNDCLFPGWNLGEQFNYPLANFYNLQGVLQWPQGNAGHTGGGAGFFGGETNDLIGYDCTNTPDNCNCPIYQSCDDNGENCTDVTPLPCNWSSTSSEGSGAIPSYTYDITLRDAGGNDVHRVDVAIIATQLCSDCENVYSCDNCIYDGGGTADKAPGGDAYCELSPDIHDSDGWHDKFRNSFELIDPQNSDITINDCTSWQLSRFRGGTPGAPPNVYTTGCSDSSACNYDMGQMFIYNGVPVASGVLDDGSCEYPEENYDCNGECNATIDDCGVCAGECFQGMPNCNCTDCLGDVIMMQVH